MCRINIVSQKLLLLILIITLAFTLANCGSNGKAGSGTGSGSTPTPTPTTIPGYGTVNGCPSDAVVASSPLTPNVIIKFTDANSTITAHVGDVVEVQLPFGQKWAGPATGGGLQLQKPAGYASAAMKMCIWHFIAQNTGTTQLTFSVGAICKKDQACPRYMSDVTFTLVVK